MNRIATLCAAAAAVLHAAATLPPAFAQAARPAPASTAKAPARGGTVSILPGGNAKEPVSIEANKLEWFDKDQKAIYTGDVVVVQGETSLRAAVLTIFMVRNEAGGAAQASGTPSGNSSIRRMEASGPVTVIQKDQVGTGDRGEYDKIANTVTLIGNVTLAQGPNITTGDKLVYNLDTKQAIVESSAQSKKRVQGVFVPGSGAPDGAKPAAKPPANSPAKSSTRPLDLQKPAR